MLLIPTYVAPSAIHGNGVFAAAPIRAGDPIWRYEPGIDLVVPDERVATLPAAFQAFLDTYAYRSVDVPEGVVLSCDHARFFNHAEQPNTDIQPFVTYAARDIAQGEEITCDYGAFVTDWAGFE